MEEYVAMAREIKMKTKRRKGFKMEKLNFKATLHAIRIDKEGESKITLTIPTSDLIVAAKMASMTESVLDVSVDVESKF